MRSATGIVLVLAVVTLCADGCSRGEPAAPPARAEARLVFEVEAHGAGSVSRVLEVIRDRLDNTEVRLVGIRADGERIVIEVAHHDRRDLDFVARLATRPGALELALVSEEPYVDANVADLASHDTESSARIEVTTRGPERWLTSSGSTTSSGREALERFVRTYQERMRGTNQDEASAARWTRVRVGSDANSSWRTYLLEPGPTLSRRDVAKARVAFDPDAASSSSRATRRGGRRGSTASSSWPR
jgi:preprotein translocase subunit SecD